TMHIVGDRIVFNAGAEVVIVDGDGKERGRVDASWLNAAAPFEDGVALALTKPVWWREGKDLIELPHDGSTAFVRAVPVGLATTEDDVLYIWRTDVQGPVAETLTTDLPMLTPVVVDGEQVVIEGAGRFALRACSVNGTTFRLGSRRPWRPITTRDEAVRIA